MKRRLLGTDQPDRREKRKTSEKVYGCSERSVLVSDETEMVCEHDEEKERKS